MVCDLRKRLLSNEQHSDLITEKQHIIKSLIPPLMLVLLLWVIKLGEIITHFDLGFLGIYPLHWKGLIGIITAPLIHANLQHLFANSVPLFVLSSALLFFYQKIAFRVFGLITLITGISVWIGAREAYHIGASGVVYGLAAFLFVSGIIRKDSRLLAITLLVGFLYGSMVWGIFPDFFPEKNISFESHFWGMISGIILAIYYKNQGGPKKKKYQWEIDEENERLEAERIREAENEIEITYSSPEKNKDSYGRLRIG